MGSAITRPHEPCPGNGNSRKKVGRRPRHAAHARQLPLGVCDPTAPATHVNSRDFLAKARGPSPRPRPSEAVASRTSHAAWEHA